MNKEYLWIVGAVILLSLFFGLQTLSIAPLTMQKTITIDGYDVQYQAAFTPLTRVHYNCNWKITDASSTTLNINAEAGSQCEAGYHPSITVSPRVDLSQYRSVVIRRTSTINTACEGRYSSLSSTINGQTKEFATSTSGSIQGQSANLADIYIQNDGLRIKIESTEGILLLDNKPDTYLTLNQFAGCTFQEGQSRQTLQITSIETTPFPTTTPTIDTPTTPPNTTTPTVTDVVLTWWERLTLWLKNIFNR